jgi:transcriptional regulator with XRE-family HTH domain
MLRQFPWLPMQLSTFTEYEHFLEELRDARRRSGLSQEQLAKRIGQDQSFVSKAERGVRRVDVVELRQWVGALGGTLTEFVSAYETRLGRNRPPPATTKKARRSR